LSVAEERLSCPNAQLVGPGIDALITQYCLCRRPAHAVLVEVDAAGLRLLSVSAVHHWPVSGRPVRWNVHPHQPAACTVISQRLCISSLHWQPAAVGLRRCAYTRTASAVADAAASRRRVVHARHHSLGAVRSRDAEVSASRASWRGEIGVIRHGRLIAITTHPRRFWWLEDGGSAAIPTPQNRECAHRLPTDSQSWFGAHAVI